MISTVELRGEEKRRAPYSEGLGRASQWRWCIGGMEDVFFLHSFQALLSANEREREKGLELVCGVSLDIVHLGDDLQDVEDELHNHRSLAQLARPAVNHRYEGAV